MRYLIFITLIILTGCATPSKITEIYDIATGESILKRRITEYDNSTFHSGKAVGLSIGVNPSTKIPEVILRYGRWESARIKSNMFYDSDYDLTDINLFTGEGSAKHRIKVGPIVYEK